jgi:hypothetical protein
MTNEQLKVALDRELDLVPVNFVQILCALEVLCAKFKVPYQQANEVIPMVLAGRLPEDQLYIKPV